MHQVNEYCIVLCLPQGKTLTHFIFLFIFNQGVIKHVTTVKTS